MSLNWKWAVAVPLVLGAVLACGPRVTVQLVANRPFEKPKVTDGDYVAKGAVDARITDESGACLIFDPSREGAQVATLAGVPAQSRVSTTRLYSNLTTEIKGETVQVFVLVDDYRGTATYPVQLSRAGRLRVAIQVVVGSLDSFGSNPAAGSSGQLYSAGSGQVTVRPDGWARVEAELFEVVPSGGGTFRVLPDAAHQVQLKGSFRCVEPEY